MTKILLKLRANIELEGDVDIAEKEIAFFCSEYTRITKENYTKTLKAAGFGIDKTQLFANTRKGKVIGYVVKLRTPLMELVLKSSFIQEIWLKEVPKEYSDISTKLFCQKNSKGFYCILPLFACAEFLTYLKKQEVKEADVKELVSYLSGTESSARIEKVVMKSLTSTPHAHGLHKYKAKFFPRLVRTFLVTESNDRNDLVVLDPFVGSGTSLIEAAFLGHRSIGVDIDRLSCLISESKAGLLKSTPSVIEKETIKYAASKKEKKVTYRFPSWISKKFDRWNTPDEREMYEREISSITNGLQNLNGAKALFQTAVSDAVSRKFNIRMMGTGVGRFALEIQKASLQKIVDENIKFLTKASSVIQTLKTVYDVSLDAPKVVNGNATALDIKAKSVDIIITSPPYLPASSGREDYLIGKSISITALNMMTETEIKRAEKGSVGSMKNLSAIDRKGLPKDVYKLYDFLKNDDLRSIKAEPTYTYYKDIKKSLQESFRVLKPKGKAIYVIGKESVFYTFKTREVLHRVECDTIFKQIAIGVGFKVKEVIDVELNKKNRNARPRSLDKYYESVFILERP